MYCGNNPVVHLDDSGTACAFIDFLYDCINRLRNLLDGGASGGGGAYSCYAGPGGVFGEGADSPYSYRTYLGYTGDGYTAYTLGIYGGPPASQVPGGSTSHGEIPVVEVGQCFIAGTLILTEEGQKPIEEISEGDLVYSTDPETGESDYKRVVQTFERETDETVDVTFEGETVTTTPNHPFYVPQKGWTSAIELKAGDILVTSNGEYVVVEKVQHEILEKPIKVYNFEVEEYHTYYVTSCFPSYSAFVFVHNSCEQQGGGHGEGKHKDSINKKIEELIQSGLYK